MTKHTGKNNVKAFKIINPKTLYDSTSFGYSHIAEVTKFNRIIHISGQSGEDISGGLSTDFHSQVKQTFENIKLALVAVDCSIADIAVLKVLIVDHNTDKHQILIQESQRIWGSLPFPTCTLIPVPRLAISDMQIEIDATVYTL